MKKINRTFIVFGIFLLGFTGAAFAETDKVATDAECSETQTSDPDESESAEKAEAPQESKVKFDDLEDTINMDFKPDQLDNHGF